MKRSSLVVLAIVVALGVHACAQLPGDFAQLGGWTTLIDGEAGLDNWNRVGDANWRAEDGAIVAYRGRGGFLVSKRSYKDFQLRAEFWADPTTNSGIFIRLSNPKRVGAENAYEVNIFDQRPDPAYRTGAIVDVAEPLVMLSTGDRWNRYEISAHGTHLVVRLNGQTTIDTNDDRLAAGPIALQYGAGRVMFRNVRIRAN